MATSRGHAIWLNSVQYSRRRCEDIHTYIHTYIYILSFYIADWGTNQIKVFSQEGRVLHTITSDMLPEDEKFNCPFGVAINRRKTIIVAQCNRECNLLAF